MYFSILAVGKGLSAITGDASWYEASKWIGGIVLGFYMSVMAGDAIAGSVLSSFVSSIVTAFFVTTTDAVDG